MQSEGLPLPHAVSGERRTIDTPSGKVSFYQSHAAEAAAAPAPLLLIHSVNAAGTAYETKPLYDRYGSQCSVYALDLPGFGFSERGDRVYTARMMVDAIHSVVAEIAKVHGNRPIDAISLSLSSEFLARAATEQAHRFRSLAFVSPTGFDSRGPYLGAPGTTRAMPWLYHLFRFPLWDKGFYRLLTTKRVIRYFLEKTWGSKNIDEGLLEYDYLTTHQPGARFAPYFFVSGYLFSRDITRIYEALNVPVWVSHGVRGDFQDFRGTERFVGNANWTVTEFRTGALPHFEVLDQFTAAYDSFLKRIKQ